MSRWRDDAEVILEHIRAALQPFRVNYITAETVDSFDVRYLRVAVDVLPNHVYEKPIDANIFLKFHPDIAIEMIALEIGEFFRNARIEPDDHIHLGEE